MVKKKKQGNLGGNPGGRRGKYAMGKPTADVTPWSDYDEKLYVKFCRSSKLIILILRQTIARRAVEADRQCRRLDTMPDRTSEQERALTAAHKAFLNAITALGNPEYKDPQESEDF